MRIGIGVLALAGAVFLARAASAQIGINEVLYNPNGTDTGLERVELKNFGAVAVNVGGWRLCSQFTYGPAFPANTMIQPGAFYVIHVHQAGTNTATEFFTGTGWVAAIGNTSDSFALYNASGNPFSNADDQEAFVEWGAVGRPRETEAVTAGNWTAGTFAPTVAEGHSIEYLGSGVGGSRWVDQPNPTIGSQNGSVLVNAKTWGIIKALYR